MIIFISSFVLSTLKSYPGEKISLEGYAVVLYSWNDGLQRRLQIFRRDKNGTVNLLFESGKTTSFMNWDGVLNDNYQPNSILLVMISRFDIGHMKTLLLARSIPQDRDSRCVG